MVLVINVPAGTPTSVATVMPAIIMATALTSLPGAASLRATIAPTPKYAPWGSPEIRRAAIKVHHRKDKSKGRIEIEYYSEAELERIVEMIESIKN